MSESTPINLQAFRPYGWAGVRLSVTSVSSSGLIPGLAGGQQREHSRIMVSNGGAYSAFVAIGFSNVAASTSSYEILPGTKELLTPPYNGPGGASLYIAAATATGETTTINACAGEGT